MNVSIRRTTILLVLACFTLSLSACNTMRGIGRDTAAVGEEIEEEAGEHVDDDGDYDRPRRPSTPSQL